MHKDYIIVGDQSDSYCHRTNMNRKNFSTIYLNMAHMQYFGVYAMFKVCPIEEALFGFRGVIAKLVCIGEKYIFCNTGYFCGGKRFQMSRLKKWHDANKCDNVTLNDGGVSLNNVKCNYDANIVINHATYKFEENKVYAIKGTNGSGKSTLVYLIAGLLLPSEGHLKVGGVEPMNFSERTYLNDIFWMPQHDPEFDVSVHELFEMFR